MKSLAGMVVLLFMTQCTAEVVCRVPSSNITHRDKFEREGEFIGFADGRAFKAVKAVPPFGGVPR